MTIIQIGDQLSQRLALAANRVQRTEVLTEQLERALISQTLQNFHAQGRPKWAGLSTVTIQMYAKRGIHNSAILQVTGALRNSIQGDSDKDSVTIQAGSGASAAYAAIQHFGGMAGRGRKVKIKARPYLPITTQGILQPEAERAVDYIAGMFISNSFI